jgi:hypothetical protein
MRKVFRHPSPAMLVAIVALAAALCGTAAAGALLNKKKVNRIITRRAPGLSVNHAKTADSATVAGSANSAAEATSAGSVGGVSVQPVSIAAATSSISTPLDVNGSSVLFQCAAGVVDFQISRTLSGPPISGEWFRDGTAPKVSHLPPGSSTGDGTPPVMAFTATVREGSGRVTRFTVDAFYEADAYGGPEDCFVQGTIERFG